MAAGSADAIAGSGPGPWTTTSAIGTSSASAFVRARVARTALWALPPTEILYFLAERDDTGRRLETRCSYELQGAGDLPARWWSIDTYVDYHFVPNPARRYSYSRTTVARSPGGGYTIRAATTPQPGNWLPLGNKRGSVQFFVRLYQPQPGALANPRSVPLPNVRRIKCS